MDKELKDYRSAIRDAEKTLNELEIAANAIKVNLDVIADAQHQLEELHRRRGALQGERDGLMADHAKALFEGDHEAAQRVQDRRAEIDHEIEEIDTKVDSASLTLENTTVDSEAIADLYVAATEVFRSPSEHDLIDAIKEHNRELRSAHWHKKREITSAIGGDRHFTTEQRHDALKRADRWNTPNPPREDPRFPEYPPGTHFDSTTDVVDYLASRKGKQPTESRINVESDGTEDDSHAAEAEKLTEKHSYPINH